MLEALTVELPPNRADTTVHHVAGSDGVGPRFRVTERRAGEELERDVVQDFAVLHDAAVTVRRVLAQADVRDHDELGDGAAERTDGLLHDPVLVVGARGGLVLRRRNSEEEDRPDPGSARSGSFVAERVDRPLRNRRQSLERPLHTLARADEERVDEVGQVDARLPDERPQGSGPPEPAQTGDGKGAHVSNLRTPILAAAANPRASTASQPSSRATVAHGWRS